LPLKPAIEGPVYLSPLVRAFFSPSGSRAFSPLFLRDAGISAYDENRFFSRGLPFSFPSSPKYKDRLKSALMRQALIGPSKTKQSFFLKLHPISPDPRPRITSIFPEAPFKPLTGPGSQNTLSSSPAFFSSP